MKTISKSGIFIPHMKYLYSEKYHIRTYEIDSLKRLTIPSMIKLMHETAMQNVINLNLSVWDLEPYKIAWVLIKKRMKIIRQPTLGEKIRIETYPAGFQKFFTHRDFLIFDAKNNLIVEASTTWLLINTETRQMTRIPERILKLEMPAPEDCLARADKQIPKPNTAAIVEKEFDVQFHQLDFNSHLNNVYFIQWMLETLGQAFLEKHTLQNLDVTYKLEANYQDILIAKHYQEEGNTFLHRLIRKKDGKEIAAALSKWK